MVLADDQPVELGRQESSRRQDQNKSAFAPFR
jgi:hypothetical protein